MQSRITLMIMLVLCTCTTWAQSSVSNSGIGQLKKMAGKYNQSGSISFNMQFRYSTEADPDVYLDSLRGSVSINGNLYTYTLGNTILIRTDEYMISIFSEEKIMQLIRLDSLNSKSPMETTGVSNAMIAALDSMQFSGLVKIFDTSAAGQHIVTIQFNNHPSWKSVQYVISESDGFLQRTVIVTKMDEMFGPGLQGKDLADGYAIVETIFSDYSMHRPEPGPMQSERYFTRNGQEIEPVTAFKDYRIILVK